MRAHYKVLRTSCQEHTLVPVLMAKKDRAVVSGAVW